MKFSYSQNYYYYLEKGMATHFSILAWRIPSTEEPGGLHGPWGSQRVRHDWATNTTTTINFIIPACSVVSDSVTPQTIACQAPLSLTFSRQEYWSGLPYPPPRDLPHSGIKPMALMPPSLAGGFFTTGHLGRPLLLLLSLLKLPK